MGRRGPKRKLDEEIVLDAALALVSADGLEALTVGRLARCLQLSPSGLYRYFESKGDIVVALQLRAIRVYGERVRHALEWRATEPMTPADIAVQRLRRGWQAWIDAAAEIPAEHGLIDAFLSAPRPMLTEAQAQLVDRHLEPVLTLLDSAHDDAVKAGALAPGDARQRTYLIWAALHGLDHFRKLDRIQPQSLQTSTLVTAMFEALLTGFGLEQASSQGAS